eukprot:232434-Pelagomonas_calceolata.AAC.2
MESGHHRHQAWHVIAGHGRSKQVMAGHGRYARALCRHVSELQKASAYPIHVDKRLQRPSNLEAAAE